MTGYRYRTFNEQTGLGLPLPSDLLHALVHPPATGRHQWLFVMALKVSVLLTTWWPPPSKFDGQLHPSRPGYGRKFSDPIDRGVG